MSKNIPKRCWKCHGPLALRVRPNTADLYCERCSRVRKRLKDYALQWLQRGVSQFNRTDVRESGRQKRKVSL